jgi:hypothetical protein
VAPAAANARSVAADTRTKDEIILDCMLKFLSPEGSIDDRQMLIAGG